MDNNQPPTKRNGGFQTVIIIVLVAVIIILLFSNTLDSDTKEKFYWFAAFVVLLIVIVYLLSRKRKMDIFKICKEVKEEEFKYTGKIVGMTELQVDELDAERLVISFESGGHIISYKWDMINGYLTARLVKKLDAIKDEHNLREINKAVALSGVQKDLNRRLPRDDSVADGDDR